MNKRITAIAYHEAGHVLAYLLTDSVFDYVTIIPSKDKSDKRLKTLGHVEPMPLLIETDWSALDFLKPMDFSAFFTSNFIDLAGFVAQKMVTDEYDRVGAHSDFNEFENKTLLNLPDELSEKYSNFLLQYVKEVFSVAENLRDITAIAAALLEKKTLNYHEVKKVVALSSERYRQEIIEFAKQES